MHCDRLMIEGKTRAELWRRLTEAIIALEIVVSGKAWISTTRIAGSTPVLRACITNYPTESEDILALVEALTWARQQAGA